MSKEKRLRDLEAKRKARRLGGGRNPEKAHEAREFLRGALAALAHVRRAGARDGGDRADAVRYSAHTLFDLEVDKELSYYLAALILLEHPDEPRAREILEIRERDDLIDRAESVAGRMRAILERRAS